MNAQTGATTEFSQFEASLADLDVAVTHVGPGEFSATLREVVHEPTIGTPLPFPSVSLPDWVDDSPTPATLEAATTGVTAATFAIAEYGSVVLPARPDGSEQVSLFPELHVVVLREADIVTDMRTAIDRLGPELRNGDSVVLATGPSATADMGALVKGAHGPKDVHVVVLEEVSTDE